MRILMVCLGNICRSPLAEGLMRDKINRHGLNWKVASAGTESYHVGEAPHRLSQKVCLDHGLDIGDLRAKRFSAVDFREYDKVYAFADDVYREIVKIGGSLTDYSKLDYFLNELHAGSNRSVPDPYYGAEDGYKRVYDLIDATCNKIIEKYKNDIYV